jgi:outer membrane protein
MPRFEIAVSSEPLTMESYLKHALILSACLAGAWPAHAEQTLSLDQAVHYALIHNPELNASEEQTLAAEARTAAARAGALPQIGFSYSLRSSNNPLDAFADKLNRRVVTSADFEPTLLNHPGTTTLNMTQLSAQLPVYTGGRVSAQIRGAESNEKAAQLQTDRNRQIIAARTAQAYLQAQAAHEAVRIADDGLLAARQHAATTASLAAQGRIVQSDRLTAQVNLAAVQSQREQAATRERLALNQLKLAMGMPLDDDLQIDAMAPPRNVDLATPVTELETRALNSRTDLQAVRRQVTASRAQVEAARAAGLPQVNVIASTTWYDDNPGFQANSWSVMGVLSQSLYSGGATRSQTAAARHDVAALEASTRAQEQAIRNEVRAAQANLIEADSRRAIAADNVERARRSVDLVRKRYGEGRTILIDLLQAERALVDARNEELAASLALATSDVALRLAEGSI